MNKKQLIESLKEEGFSKRILSAFERVSREKFISENLRSYAYCDIALSLEFGATISQPSTIAFMLNLLELKKGHKILEIGSGCGYVLALLYEITKGEVFGVELMRELALTSRKVLRGLNYNKIKVINKNGYFGLITKALFDRILVSASANKIPKHLLSQLKDNGIMVVPVGNSIFKFKRRKGKVLKEEFPGFAFVHLIK